MNDLAIQLNQTIENSAAFHLLSDYGKRFFFPSKGIVAQAAQAKELAHRYDATVGMACYKQKPIRTKPVKNFTSALTEEETLAYAPTPGIKDLRKVWKKEIYRKNPDLHGALISLPVVVPGLTAGISEAAKFFFEKGTNLVLPDMFWGNYRMIFENAQQSQIKLFPFFTNNGTTQAGMNIEAYRQALKEHAQNRQIRTLLNFPNNPTGYSPSIEEVEKIQSVFLELANEGYEILVLIDDAYFGLFYEPQIYKQSIFAKLAHLHPNVLAVKIDGMTKEHFVWGLRVGFVTFGCKDFTQEQYNALEQKLSGSIRASISNSSRLSQSILYKVLTQPNYESERSKYDAHLEKRYRIACKMVQTLPDDFPLQPLPFNSGYFMTFKVKGDADQLRLHLLKSEGIGTISIGSDYLRIAFSAVDEELIEDLYQRVFKAAKEFLV